MINYSKASVYAHGAPKDKSRPATCFDPVERVLGMIFKVCKPGYLVHIGVPYYAKHDDGTTYVGTAYVDHTVVDGDGSMTADLVDRSTLGALETAEAGQYLLDAPVVDMRGTVRRDDGSEAGLRVVITNCLYTAERAQNSYNGYPKSDKNKTDDMKARAAGLPMPNQNGFDPLESRFELGVKETALDCYQGSLWYREAANSTANFSIVRSGDGSAQLKPGTILSLDSDAMASYRAGAARNIPIDSLRVLYTYIPDRIYTSDGGVVTIELRGPGNMFRGLFAHEYLSLLPDGQDSVKNVGAKPINFFSLPNAILEGADESDPIEVGVPDGGANVITESIACRPVDNSPTHLYVYDTATGICVPFFFGLYNYGPSGARICADSAFKAMLCASELELAIRSQLGVHDVSLSNSLLAGSEIRANEAYAILKRFADAGVIVAGDEIGKARDILIPVVMSGDNYRCAAAVEQLVDEAVVNRPFYQHLTRNVVMSRDEVVWLDTYKRHDAELNGLTDGQEFNMRYRSAPVGSFRLASAGAKDQLMEDRTGACFLTLSYDVASRICGRSQREGETSFVSVYLAVMHYLLYTQVLRAPDNGSVLGACNTSEVLKEPRSLTELWIMRNNDTENRCSLARDDRQSSDYSRVSVGPDVPALNLRRVDVLAAGITGQGLFDDGVQFAANVLTGGDLKALNHWLLVSWDAQKRAARVVYDPLGTLSPHGSRVYRVEGDGLVSDDATVANWIAADAFGRLIDNGDTVTVAPKSERSATTVIGFAIDVEGGNDDE